MHVIRIVGVMVESLYRILSIPSRILAVARVYTTWLHGAFGGVGSTLLSGLLGRTMNMEFHKGSLQNHNILRTPLRINK